MNWLPTGLAILGWGLVLILWLTFPLQTARREKSCVNRLRNHLEPYLKRRAADLDLLHGFPETTPALGPLQVVDTLCQQVALLADHEKSAIAVSDTLPIDVTKLDDRH